MNIELTQYRRFIILAKYMGYDAYPKLLLKTKTHLFAYLPGHSEYLNRISGSVYCEPQLLVFEIQTEEGKYFDVKKVYEAEYSHSTKEQRFKEVEKLYNVALPRKAIPTIPLVKYPSKWLLYNNKAAKVVRTTPDDLVVVFFNAENVCWDRRSQRIYYCPVGTRNTFHFFATEEVLLEVYRDIVKLNTKLDVEREKFEKEWEKRKHKIESHDKKVIDTFIRVHSININKEKEK